MPTRAALSITAGPNSMYGPSAANPIYSNVFIIRSNQNSNYNGLQVTVETASHAPCQRQRLLQLEQDTAEQHTRQHRRL